MVFSTTIIITHNRPKLTKWCIESWLNTTPRDNNKLVIVDNNSGKDLKNWLISMKEKNEIDQLLLNSENYYVGKAWNIGYNQLIEDSVWIGKIDNDAYFQDGWYENFVKISKTVDCDLIIMLPINNIDKNNKLYRCKNNIEYYLGINNTNFYTRNNLIKKYNIKFPENNKMTMNTNLIFINTVKKYTSSEKVIKILGPGITLEKERYNDPEEQDYYNKTFGQRNLLNLLKSRIQIEHEGKKIVRQ